MKIFYFSYENFKIYHMQYEETSWYSSRVNREMKIRIYGHYGVPILVFPCQDKQSDDFSNNGMIDTLSWYIDNGKIKLYCVDSIDDITVSSTDWDKAHAAYMLEQYHQYIINEVLPFIYDKQKGYCLPYLLGLSMGASHSANTFFRRPELFSGFLALSGNYDIASFFNGYMNNDVYNNSPVHYLTNMDYNHPYIDIYNQKKIIIVVGQGAWEHLVYYSNEWINNILNSKGINAWVEFRDANSYHDWSSWKSYIGYYLNYLIE